MTKMRNKFYYPLIQPIVVLMLFFPPLVYAEDGNLGAESVLSVRSVDQDAPPASVAATVSAVSKRAAFVAKPAARKLSPAEGRFIIESESLVPAQIGRSKLEVKSDDAVDDHSQVSTQSAKMVAGGSTVDTDQNSKTSPRRILENIDSNYAYERVVPASPPPVSASPKKKPQSKAKTSVLPMEDVESKSEEILPLKKTSEKRQFIPKAPRILAKAQGKIEIGGDKAAPASLSSAVTFGNGEVAKVEEVTPDDSKHDDVDVVVASPPSASSVLQTSGTSGAVGGAVAAKRQFTKKVVKTLAKPIHIDSLPPLAAKVSVAQRGISDGMQINLNSPLVASEPKALATDTQIIAPFVVYGVKLEDTLPDILPMQSKITEPVMGVVASSINPGNALASDVPLIRLNRQDVVASEEVILPTIAQGVQADTSVFMEIIPKPVQMINSVLAQAIGPGQKILIDQLAPHISAKEAVVKREVRIPSISQGLELDLEIPQVFIQEKVTVPMDHLSQPTISGGSLAMVELPDLGEVSKSIFHNLDVVMSDIELGTKTGIELPPVLIQPKRSIWFQEVSPPPISSGAAIDVEVRASVMTNKEVMADMMVTAPGIGYGDEVNLDIPDVRMFPKVIIPDSGFELPKVSLGVKLEDTLPDMPMGFKRKEPVMDVTAPLIEVGNEFIDELPSVRMNQKDVVVNNDIVLPVIAPGLEVNMDQPAAYVDDKDILSEVMVILPAIPLGNIIDTDIVAIPARLHVIPEDTTVLMPIDAPVNSPEYIYTLQGNDTTTVGKEKYIIQENEYSTNDQLSLGADKAVLSGDHSGFEPTMPISEVTKTVADYVKQGMQYAISSFETINAIISARLDIFKSELTVGVAAGDENNIVEKGVWSKIFTSKTTQDNSIGQAEFNNRQNGFIIGVDVELKDENVFGIAVTRSDSKTNFFSSVDNSQKSDLYSVILYNEMSMTDKLYLNTNLKYGKAYVQHKIHTANPLSGKTTADIFSASVDSVYKHKSTNGTLISPIARLTFSNFFIDDFSEINDEIKVYIPHKRARVLLAQGGIGFKRAIPFGKSKLEIEFHGGIETILALRQSNDMITVISDVSEHIQGKFVHPTKTRYNFGANLAVVTDMGLRYGVSAEHIFANRYRSSGAFLFLVYHF